jgi:hypothetical protein
MTPESDMDTNGTCKHAVLAVTQEYLLSILGDSHTVEGGLGWMFRDSLDQRWTIYDHKGSAKNGLFSLGGECDSDVDSKVLREFVKEKLPGARLLWIADSQGGMSYSLMSEYMEFISNR